MRYTLILGLVIAGLTGCPSVGAAPASGLTSLKTAVEDANPTFEIARRCYRRIVRFRRRVYYGPRFCTSRRVARYKRVRCYRSRGRFYCAGMRG